MKRSLWWIVAVLVLLYVVLGLSTGTAPSSYSDEAGAITASGPHGSMAVERLWESVGLSWTTWEQIPAFLPPDGRGVFVSVEPDGKNYQARDIASLLDYARAGHEVVWVSDVSDQMLQQLDLYTNFTNRLVKITSLHVQPGLAKETAMTWSNLDFGTQTTLAGSGLQSAGTLYRDSAGAPVGASFPIGRGTIVIWTAPAVWENGWIGKADNLQVVWHLVGNRTLVWDEYGHGLAQQNTLGWMFRSTRIVALILGVIAFLLYIYRNFLRFGPVRRVRLDKPMLGVDFLEALGWHLSRPKLRAIQFHEVVDVVQARIARQGTEGGRTALDAASQWVASRASPELSVTWRDWRNLAAAGYQRRRWRMFLRLTQKLLTQVELQAKP